jgi:DNA-binding transcriptional ArsR family regulator
VEQVSFNQMVEHSLDATYGALAHPTRRAALERLRSAPLRVTDLAAPFDVSLAAVSKHIRVLEAAGLVERAVVGRDHVLSLRADPLAPADAWLATYRSFWEDRLDELEALLLEDPDA